MARPVWYEHLTDLSVIYADNVLSVTAWIAVVIKSGMADLDQVGLLRTKFFVGHLSCFDLYDEDWRTIKIWIVCKSIDLTLEQLASRSFSEFQVDGWQRVTPQSRSRSTLFDSLYQCANGRYSYSTQVNFATNWSANFCGSCCQKRQADKVYDWGPTEHTAVWRTICFFQTSIVCRKTASSLVEISTKQKSWTSSGDVRLFWWNKHGAMVVWPCT